MPSALLIPQKEVLAYDAVLVKRQSTHVINGKNSLVRDQLVIDFLLIEPDAGCCDFIQSDCPPDYQLR
jgi:hypothetical protein